MINKFIASVSTFVELRGKDILQVQSITEEVVTYRLIGFEDRSITIQDYRPAAMEAVGVLLSEGRTRDFAAMFNTPANLLLFTGSEGEVLIQLMDTHGSEPPYMFWINLGEQETLPLTHSCLFQDERQLADQRKVFVSLHKRIHRGQTLAEHGSLWSPGMLTPVPGVDAGASARQSSGAG